MTKTPSGLEYEDTQVGTGKSPARGQKCVMHYTGWLWVDGAKGAKFDSSHDRNKPFDFSIGMGDRVLHVRNAPSPAATASLAIGRHVAGLAIERFGLGAR